MSDWEIYTSDIEKPSIQSSSDWETLSASEEKPSFGQALAEAPGKIVQDIYGMVTDFTGKIPQYYESAKTEIPGLFSTAKQHPGHLALQALAGTQEGINVLAQLPLYLSQYGKNRLNLLPQSVPNAIKKFIPEDTTESIKQLFSEPEYPGESLARGLGKIGTEYFAGGNIPQGIGSGIGLASDVARPLTSRLPSITSKGIAKDIIIKPHDILENKATYGFKKVSNEINKRGINNIPVNEEEIKSLSEYFPKTKQSEQLINDASIGKYNALRKIQSELYTRGKKNLGSDLETDRLRGEEMFEKRNNINESISNHLKNTGNHDLDKKLNESRMQYKKLQDTYYNPYINNAIVKMVDKDIRKIPNNLMTILKEDSKPMRNFINSHPGLNASITRNYIARLLSKGTAGIAGIYGLKNYLSPSNVLSNDNKSQ